MHFSSKVFFSALSLTVFSFFPIAVHAKPTGVARISATSSQSCETAIASVKTSLAKGGYFIPWKYPTANPRDAKTITPRVVFDNESIQKYYYEYPTQRTQTVIFRLSGDGTRLYQGLMSSPQLMATLSAQVMAGCNQVGLVEFSHWHEGYVPVGYFPDNTARTFTWNDLDEKSPHQRWIQGSNGSTIQHQWGYYFSP